MEKSNINEALQLDGTILSIVDDLGNPLGNLYRQLKASAENYIDKNLDLKGWDFLRAGVEQREWWDKVWQPKSKRGEIKAARGLQGELHDLSTQAGGRGTALSRYLSKLRNNRGNFASMAQTLPEILARLARDLQKPHLFKRAKNWEREHAEFLSFLENLIPATGTHTQDRDSYEDWLKRHLARNKKLGGDIDSPSLPPAAAATTVLTPSAADIQKKVPSALKTQIGAAEVIVNDILSNLPAGIRGDIRNAISRYENKLLALQKELDKRGIDISNLTEQLHESLNLYHTAVRLCKLAGIK